MREVFIDLSPDSHLQEVKVFGGYSGEQNETLLKIKLPERMISNDFLYYYFKFETDCNEEILSVPIPYTEITNSIIETPLWQQLTKNGFLKVNVVASNGIITESPSRIAMTNTIVLAIKKSPNGQKVFIDPNAVELQLLQLIDERVLRDLQNLGELVVDQTYTPTSPNAQSGIAVAEALSGYVMAEVGKGLSTNDFTDDDKKQVDNSIKIAGISNGELSFKMNAGVYNIKAFTKITFRTYASSSDGMTTMGSTKLGSTSTDTFLFVSFINTTPSYQIKEFRLSGGNRETVYRITRATNAATGEYTDTLTDETPKVDQTYTPTSPNAQSGIAVAEALSGYVMAEVGKGLSSNDFTDEDKEKLGSALQADDISDKMDKFGVVELDGTRLGDVTASVKNFQLLNLTGESGLGLGNYEASLNSKGRTVISKLNAETGDSTEVAVGDGVVTLSKAGKIDVILNGVATPTDDNHGTNKQYVDEAVAEAVGVANDYTDKAIKSLKTYANNTFAPAIKNTVSGSVLAVHDVSPVEHALNIKLSSDTVTDFSGVTVSRCGKNLIPSLRTVSPDVNYYGITFTNNEDGSITANGTAVHGCYYWLTGQNSILLPAGTYIFSSGLEDGSTSTQYASFTYGTGKEVYSYADKNGKFILTEPTLCGCCFAIHEGTVLDNVTLYPQLELGSTATDYEPYNGQTVTANADGTVEGLTSISPDMTIMTDTEGVVIDMTYNADTKMYIDNKLAEISTAIVNNV